MRTTERNEVVECLVLPVAVEMVGHDVRSTSTDFAGITLR